MNGNVKCRWKNEMSTVQKREQFFISDWKEIDGPCMSALLETLQKISDLANDVFHPIS